LYDELTRPILNPDVDLFNEAANINYLRVLPAKFGQPVLVNADVVNPSVWAISAQSHYILAHENPAYDALLNPSRVQEIISPGNAVQSVIKAVTAPNSFGKHPLFDALITNYQNQVQAFEVAKQAMKKPYFDAHTFSINPFPFSQGAIPYTAPFQVGRCDGAATPLLSMPDGFGDTIFTDFRIAMKLGIGSIGVCYELSLQNNGNGISTVIMIHARYQDSQVPLTTIETGTICFCTVIVLGGPYDPYSSIQHLWEVGPVFDQTLHQYTGRQWFETFSGGFSASPDFGSVYTEVATKVTIQLNLWQADFYEEVQRQMKPGGQLFAAATKVDGAKAAIEAFLLLGMPRTLQADDYLRSLIYGAGGLLGRSDDGVEDSSVFVYQPQIDHLRLMIPPPREAVDLPGKRF